MTDAESDVLIVGAGPTGMTLACALAQRKVRVRIIDAASAPPTSSRGKGLQPRSLELFDDLGIVVKVLACGVFDLPIRYYDEAGRWKDDSLPATRARRFDAPFLRPLIIPQWRVEEILRQKLALLDVPVEFGSALASITQGEGGVTAHLSGENAGPIRTGWLVGCDGGKSLVRHLTGIPFLGETLESHRMLLGDVHVEGIDRGHWHIWKSAEGFLALCPLPSTDSFQLQASVAPGQESEPSLEVLQDIVVRRSGNEKIRISEPTWLSLWRANVRMVDRFREGRVFIAGDAAHVHSPAGGQGMNTGIQDAYNLGWKLAAVVGGAKSALLDSYQEERLPIAAAVLGISNEIMAATVAAGTIMLRRDERTLQLDLNYRRSSLARELRPARDGLRAGDRAPDAPGLIGPDGPCRVFDLLRGPHASLLGFGMRWQGVVAECAEEFGEAVRGYVIIPASEAQPGRAAHYLDAEGHAQAAYGNSSGYIIRPDNYVGMATADANSAPIVDYLSQFLRRRE